MLQLRKGENIITRSSCGDDAARRPGRPTQIEAADREVLLLDAAERVILRAGLGNASMAAIAHEAGMSKRTLYTIFDNRTALFAAIVRRIRNTVTHPLSGDELELPLDRRLRLLLGPVENKLSVNVAMAILRAMIAEAERHPELASVFLKEGIEAMRAMVRAELDRSVASGEIRIADTRAAASLLCDMACYNAVESLIAMPSQALSGSDLQRRLDLAIRVFLHGIADCN